jgi:hypothetical protein
MRPGGEASKATTMSADGFPAVLPVQQPSVGGRGFVQDRVAGTTIWMPGEKMWGRGTSKATS